MLLPTGEQTVIGTIIDALEGDDRIDDIYVSTNEKFAEAFGDYLAESDFEKPQLSIEDTTAESEKFGVVGALSQLVEREGLTEDMLVVAGDNLNSFDIADFLDAFQVYDEPTLASYDVGSYDRASSYGLVELKDGYEVIDFQEKPDDPKSTLVSIACYAFPGETLSLLKEYLSGDNNLDEPGWFIEWLQDRETVHVFTFEEAWFDIRTPESYLDAVDWFLDGDAYVHPDAELVDTSLGDSVQILEGARLEDTTVENSVIFPEATITGGKVRRSIVDEDTQVESLNLSGAVIGAHTRLNGSGS